jgi:hypothetical protein
MALHDHRERKGAADSAWRALVAGEERAQIVLVPDGAGRGVDHADRIVVVVGDDQRGAVVGDADAAGVGPDVERCREADALIGMTQCNLGRRGPGAARLGVDIDRVVRATRGVNLSAASGGKSVPRVTVGVLSPFRYTLSISFYLEATVAFKRATTGEMTVSLSPAARRWNDRRRGQEHAFALPRTSRYRAHDDDPEEVSGCLGASSRHATVDAEPQGEPE